MNEDKNAIKEILRKEKEATKYRLSKAIGKSQSDYRFQIAYWQAKYELLEEQINNVSKEETTNQIPDEVYSGWKDRDGQIYMKGSISEKWRVYPKGLEFGYFEEIDEHKVKVRYAMEKLTHKEDKTNG